MKKEFLIRKKDILRPIIFTAFVFTSIIGISTIIFNAKLSELYFLILVGIFFLGFNLVTMYKRWNEVMILEDKIIINKINQKVRISYDSIISLDLMNFFGIHDPYIEIHFKKKSRIEYVYIYRGGFSLKEFKEIYKLLKAKVPKQIIMRSGYYDI